ncbi:MAG: Flp pilus assembly complex ATPase component TadA [Alphaproteobacteria bacterium]|nr:Flp pilus assembly complex ATPase component TadA [Alphaproteobacteria bacterium]
MGFFSNLTGLIKENQHQYTQPNESKKNNEAEDLLKDLPDLKDLEDIDISSFSKGTETNKPQEPKFTVSPTEDKPQKLEIREESSSIMTSVANKQPTTTSSELPYQPVISPVASKPQEPVMPKPVVSQSVPQPNEPQKQNAPVPPTAASPAQATPAPAASQPKDENLQPTKNSGILSVDGRAINCQELGEMNSVNFSDVYITPDKQCYFWGGKTNAGLVNISFSDFNDFFDAIEKAYEGTRSYLLQYKGRNYRVERTITMEGPQYCARKMPTKVPNLRDLGLPQGVYNHLMSLAGGSGLILLAGATGSGKSTTIAALLKEYLSLKGGYAFTIEDPVELPLDGVYITPNNELGLCKQTTPPDGSWEEGIKSALRSKPRYIYLGEIRSPDIASEALRAATSGHLVLSSIHANNVSEAINSLVKYAASSGISEAMAFELVAGGFLGCVHQILSGAPKRAHVSTLFANPDVNAGCPVRGMIRSGKLNMATLIEQQRTLLAMQKPLFSNM